MNRKVAIHQPNYLPWPGYFYKLWLCDTFVLLDHVKLNKQGLTRRTYIPNLSTADTKRYLTVPLVKHSDNTPINELRIDHTKGWATKHYNILNQLYHKIYPESALWPLISDWYKSSAQFELLAEWNVFLLKQILSYLEIERKMILSSSLNVGGVKDEMHTEIISMLDGNMYISGTTGTAYRKDHIFKAHNINIVDTDFLSLMNMQPYKETNFQSGLNILDILFHLGKDGLLSYFENLSDVPK